MGDTVVEEGFQLAGKENYSKVVINKPLCVPLLAHWDQRWELVITLVLCYSLHQCAQLICLLGSGCL